MTVTQILYIHEGQIDTNPGALKLIMTPQSIVTHQQLCIVPALASYQYSKNSHRPEHSAWNTLLLSNNYG